MEHDEGQSDPLGGNAHDKEKKMTDKGKMNVHNEVSPWIKKKKKDDKLKGVMPLVLVEGEINKIGENF